jgi:hypothetical protein
MQHFERRRQPERVVQTRASRLEVAFILGVPPRPALCAVPRYVLQNAPPTPTSPEQLRLRWITNPASSSADMTTSSKTSDSA